MRTDRYSASAEVECHWPRILIFAYETGHDKSPLTFEGGFYSWVSGCSAFFLQSYQYR